MHNFSKEKCDAKVEFPEKWGVQAKTLQWGGGGGMDSSWSNTVIIFFLSDIGTTRYGHPLVQSPCFYSYFILAKAKMVSDLII